LELRYYKKGPLRQRFCPKIAGKRPKKPKNEPKRAKKGQKPLRIDKSD
jgi:hypothetical protein